MTKTHLHLAAVVVLCTAQLCIIGHYIASNLHIKPSTVAYTVRDLETGRIYCLEWLGPAGDTAWRDDTLLYQTVVSAPENVMQLVIIK